MQTWYNADWYEFLLKELIDWLNCSSQLTNYQSRSSPLENCGLAFHIHATYLLQFKIIN